MRRDTGAERGQGVDAAGARYSRSLQLGVFRLGLLENRDVGVGVLPEREESMIRTFSLGVVSR